MIATVSGLGRVKIPAFPTQCSLVARDLMPTIPRWPASDEDQLRLTPMRLKGLNWEGTRCHHMKFSQATDSPQPFTPGEGKQLHVHVGWRLQCRRFGLLWLS